MGIKFWLLGGVALLVTACAEVQTSSTAGVSASMSQIPDSVRELAATNQDLTDVRIDPDNGCYVYRHTGPVETTYLPLRAANGRPICSRAADAGVAS